MFKIKFKNNLKKNKIYKKFKKNNYIKHILKYIKILDKFTFYGNLIYKYIHMLKNIDTTNLEVNKIHFSIFEEIYLLNIKLKYYQKKIDCKKNKNILNKIKKRKYIITI